MASLKLGLVRKKGPQLIAMAEIVIKNLAPPPPAVPPIAGMDAKVVRLQTARDEAKSANEAYENAKSALKYLREKRNEKFKKLRLEHASVASGVESAALGDKATLTASGYALAAKGVSTSGPPGSVANLNVTAGRAEGELRVQHDPLEGARSYELQISMDDPVEGPWVTQCSQTKSRCTLSGLTSGQRVWVRVRGLGPKGHGGWSDPYTKIVP